jgi:hypothetical protein
VDNDVADNNDVGLGDIGVTGKRRRPGVGLDTTTIPGLLVPAGRSVQHVGVTSRERSVFRLFPERATFALSRARRGGCVRSRSLAMPESTPPPAQPTLFARSVDVVRALAARVRRSANSVKSTDVLVSAFDSNRDIARPSVPLDIETPAGDVPVVPVNVIGVTRAVMDAAPGVSPFFVQSLIRPMQPAESESPSPAPPAPVDASTGFTAEPTPEPAPEPAPELAPVEDVTFDAAREVDAALPPAPDPALSPNEASDSDEALDAVRAEGSAESAPDAPAAREDADFRSTATLVEALEAVRLTEPVFPPSVWDRHLIRVQTDAMPEHVTTDAVVAPEGIAFTTRCAHCGAREEGVYVPSPALAATGRHSVAEALAQVRDNLDEAYRVVYDDILWFSQGHTACAAGSALSTVDPSVALAVDALVGHGRAVLASGRYPVTVVGYLTRDGAIETLVVEDSVSGSRTGAEFDVAAAQSRWAVRTRVLAAPGAIAAVVVGTMAALGGGTNGVDDGTAVEPDDARTDAPRAADTVGQGDDAMLWLLGVVTPQGAHVSSVLVTTDPSGRRTLGATIVSRIDAFSGLIDGMMPMRRWLAIRPDAAPPVRSRPVRP